MSLRAMMRNVRRGQGYAHTKDDYRLEGLAPAGETTLAHLLERGKEFQKTSGMSVTLANEEDIRTFEKVNILDLPEAQARFLLGDVVYEQVVQAIPFMPRGAPLKVTSIDGKARVVEVKSRGRIQIGG